MLNNGSIGNEVARKYIKKELTIFYQKHRVIVQLYIHIGISYFEIIYNCLFSSSFFAKRQFLFISMNLDFISIAKISSNEFCSNIIPANGMEFQTFYQP